MNTTARFVVEIHRTIVETREVGPAEDIIEALKVVDDAEDTGELFGLPLLYTEELDAEVMVVRVK